MPVLNFDAIQITKVITYDGYVVWGDVSQNEILEALPEDYLTFHPRDLIIVATTRRTNKKKKKGEDKGGSSKDDDINDCRLIPEKLAQVVGSTSSVGGDGTVVAGWARFVANLTNLDRPATVEKGNRCLSGMYYQQLVFAPVAGLYYCFNHETYVANETASSGFGCTSLTTPGKEEGGIVTHRNVPFLCRPHAACLATAHELVLGAMQVRDHAGKLDGDGMFDCALLTSMTAVAMVRQGVVAATHGAVFVPFVVNVGEKAILYVATLQRDDPAPAVRELSQANFCRRKERVRLVALLACLLHKLHELLRSSPEGWSLTRFLERVPPPPCHTTSSSGSGTNDNSRRGESELDGILRPSSSWRRRSSGAASAEGDDHDSPASVMAALGAASRVASCEGQVTDLVPFSTRYTDSPFYFLGMAVRTTDPSQATATSATAAETRPVFVKVWREGDERTSLTSVQREMDLLDRAHQAGVPCPAVVPALTDLSILQDGDVFHRLVMHQVANCAVDPSDSEAYALSLVKAILRLHAAGILHCDIKPANVAWDATAKAACLLDFGLSQWEEEKEGASFAGTQGYTAPEVEQKREPHSRRSDAYSVGRTILTVVGGPDAALDGTSSATFGEEVVDVARLLSLDASDGRITLEDALDWLERSKPKGDTFT